MDPRSVQRTTDNGPRTEAASRWSNSDGDHHDRDPDRALAAGDQCRDAAAPRRAAVTSEISQLAQALASFKSKYGDYPPSRFLAVENGNYSAAISAAPPCSAAARSPIRRSPGDGDITLGLARPAVGLRIRKFWPRVNTSTGAGHDVLGYDFNGNGTQPMAPTSSTATSAWSSSWAASRSSRRRHGNFGMTGFDKDPTEPVHEHRPVHATNRQPPLFEFNAGRLFLDPFIVSTTGYTGIPATTTRSATPRPRRAAANHPQFLRLLQRLRQRRLRPQRRQLLQQRTTGT